MQLYAVSNEDEPSRRVMQLADNDICRACRANQIHELDSVDVLHDPNRYHPVSESNAILDLGSGVFERSSDILVRSCIRTRFDGSQPTEVRQQFSNPVWRVESLQEPNEALCRDHLH